MAIEGYSQDSAAYTAALEKETTPEVRQVAENLVGAFGLAPNEDFYLITDGDVMRVNGDIVQAVEEEARRILAERGSKDEPGKQGHFKMLVATPAERSAVPFGEHIGQYLEAPGSKAVLIMTRMSRSWAKETQEALNPDRGLTEMVRRSGARKVAQENLEAENLEERFQMQLKALAEKRKARLISITKGANRDVLTKGAILEPLPDIKRRAEKVDELMTGVVRARITNDAGTDLTVEFRPEFAHPETGEFDKPGMVGNMPVGEWYVLPKKVGTTGTLVIHDAPMGGGIPREKMDGHTVVMSIDDGKLLAIEDKVGTGPANMLREYLEAGRKPEHGEQGNPFQIAEFAIGVNSKAWRDVDGERKVASTSVEGEKAYGTVHVAFGANGIYGQPANDPELNRVETHADCIVLEPTVECFREDGSSFFIIKEGEPQGY